MNMNSLLTTEVRVALYFSAIDHVEATPFSSLDVAERYAATAREYFKTADVRIETREVTPWSAA
jgi:hypothetical protein